MYSKQVSKTEVDAILAELSHDPESRAEQLDVHSLLRLANRFFQAVQRPPDVGAANP
jgi:16S rRNA A1518/A1519 N6-dimethyltransferase RsmA/KsgA/DIM1 with predicted DNA glycosylase/AP lyase activity